MLCFVLFWLCLVFGAVLVFAIFGLVPLLYVGTDVGLYALTRKYWYVGACILRLANADRCEKVQLFIYSVKTNQITIPIVQKTIERYIFQAEL